MTREEVLDFTKKNFSGLQEGTPTKFPSTPTPPQDGNQILLVSDNNIMVVSEPDVPVMPPQPMEIPEAKFQSPSIERKISVIDPPNLQDLAIPLETVKPEEKKLEKKISRFLVSPVLDKPLEENPATEGSVAPAEPVIQSASQNIVSIPDEIVAPVQEAQPAEVPVVEKPPLRRHSSTQQSDISVRFEENFLG